MTHIDEMTEKRPQSAISRQACALPERLQVTTATTTQIRADMLECMRRLAATVSVVALRDEHGAFVSATVTSAMLATMDPPTMLVCLNRSTRLGSAITQAKLFSINILSTQQASVAAACAGGIEHAERFAGADWRQLDPQRVPILTDAQASMVCKTVKIVTSGTHDVVFAEVFDARHRPEATPLLYLNRAYGQFQALPAD